jgi:hypothetical protein
VNAVRNDGPHLLDPLPADEVAGMPGPLDGSTP